MFRCLVVVGRGNSACRVAHAASPGDQPGVSRRTADQLRCLLPLILFSIAVLGTSTGQENFPQNDNQTENPPGRVARISYLKGNVSFLRAGVNEWSAAALNFPVTAGDRIYTEKGARAELEAGSATARLAGSTDLVMTALDDRVMQLGVEQGTLRITVYQLSSGETVEVDTPNGTVTFSEPGSCRFDVDSSGDRSDISVYHGAVEISGEGVSQQLGTGQAVRLAGQNPVELESIPLPPPDDFDRWSEERDRRLTSSRSREYVSPATPGLDDLDSYGRWEVVSEYGPVWFPPVAVGWVPYRLGHWVWIDPWGWSWVEDEPWGFCQFHFGRWAFIGSVWGWVPGPIVPSPIYAPAFVAFIGGANFSGGIGVDLVGWFPLGPDEPYFPWYHYDREYLRILNITNVRNVTRITNIINVTNVNNIHYAYKTVATTVVPANVLSSGQAVAHHVMRVPTEQLARAPIVPHPPANPTLRAAIPGRPVRPPSVKTVPLTAARVEPHIVNPTPHPAGREPAGAIAPHAPPATGAMRPPPPPPAAGRPQAPSAHVGSVPRIVEPPPLPVRRPSPPPPIPFVQRREAMTDHPGRPLEPSQAQDLRAGRPVGPMRDIEFPPHPAPVVRAQPPPPPRHEPR